MNPIKSKWYNYLKKNKKTKKLCGLPVYLIIINSIMDQREHSHRFP